MDNACHIAGALLRITDLYREFIQGVQLHRFSKRALQWLAKGSSEISGDTQMAGGVGPVWGEPNLKNRILLQIENFGQWGTCRDRLIKNHDTAVIVADSKLRLGADHPF